MTQTMQRFLILLLITLAWWGGLAEHSRADEEESASNISAKVAAETASTARLVRLGQVRSFHDLQQLIAERANQPYVPRPKLSEKLAALTYDDYVNIRYRHSRATWWGGQSPFWIETFHRGYVQRDRVDLFVSENGTNRWVPFSASDFDYRISGFHPTFAGNSGHAGIKVAGRFPGSDQEMLTFLGSSYFRARPEQSVYGTSARGLAINIAMNQDEEFPAFRVFWVKKPSVNDKALTVLGLLDSPSVVGAYQFQLKPGSDQTDVEVTAKLIFRQAVTKLAIAPLTSMWIWGDGLEGPPKETRPAVHDSDGLLIRTAKDRWIWRALARPTYPSVSRIEVDQIQGFGLMQRNTAFFHFNDYNAKYHLRPSVFITPREIHPRTPRGTQPRETQTPPPLQSGGASNAPPRQSLTSANSTPWRDGVIELLEIPGAHEGIDNIGAFWVPRPSPQAGDVIDLRYDVEFFRGAHRDQGQVGQASTFQLDRETFADDKPRPVVGLQIRFSGGPLAEIPASTPIDFEIQTTRGTVDPPTATKTQTGDWLVDTVMRFSEDAPMEVKLTVKLEEQPVTETFSYLCPPKEPKFSYPAVYTRQE